MMTMKNLSRSPANAATRYAALTQLIRRIAIDGDPLALDELHSRRPIFRYAQDTALLLGDFLCRLRESRQTDPTQILDQAYDLTLDKFSRLLPEPKAITRLDDQVKHPGPDCRYYYRAFLAWLESRETDDMRGSQVEEEYKTARLFQQFVTRHFHLSLLEARRSANPTVSRYAWHVDGRGSITVWLPKSMKGEDRRSWLEKNVEDPDPARPGERERIQAHIDARIARGWLVPLEQVENTMACCAQDSDPRMAALFAEQEEHSLPEFVAKEKALSIDRQRKAIRALGPAKLERLVLAVFDNILDKGKTEEALAREHGLSKATFSRFAGSCWGTGGFIQDLWLNTAHVLAHHPRFVEQAHRAGVFRLAKAAASPDRRPRLRSCDYGQ